MFGLFLFPGWFMICHQEPHRKMCLLPYCLPHLQSRWAFAGTERLRSCFYKELGRWSHSCTDPFRLVKKQTQEHKIPYILKRSKSFIHPKVSHFRLPDLYCEGSGKLSALIMLEEPWGKHMPNKHVLFLGPYPPLPSPEQWPWGRPLSLSSISAQPHEAGNVNEKAKIKEQEMKPGEEAEKKREGNKRETRAKESKGKKEEGDRLGQKETDQ